MNRYRVTKRLYGGVPSRVYEIGEIIELAIGSWESMTPLDPGAPMEPRKFDIPGYSHLRIEQRAEVAATRLELANRKPAGSDPK